jgi:hypothetical protein
VKNSNFEIRISKLALAAILTAASGSAQEPQYFEKPKARFTFRWDALARYDRIYHLRVRPDIERGRFEFRPEIAFEVSDRFKIAARAVGSLGTDENEDNAPNFDNYRSNGATLERYYLEARPGAWTIRAGSFGMPLAATEMLWDRDIQTPGAAVSWTLPVETSSLSLAAAGFYGPQRDGDRSTIGAGQVLWRVGEPERVSFEMAAAYWHFQIDDLKPHYLRQNRSVIRGGTRELESDFRIVDTLVRLRFPVAGLPVSISLDGLRNFGTETGENYAFEGQLAVGRLGTPGDWRAFYTYQYVERDAVVGAYNTDDWWFHSWYRGHRGGVAVTFLPSVFVQGAVVFQRRLDLKTTLNRITVDLVKMF